ncbi:MAG TPA: thioredoxin family protein [Ferruginibacter sp.]|nr:thioredoxin family protein [Ferruginibacter sp.]
MSLRKLFKGSIFIAFSVLLFSFTSWQPDLEAAKKAAKANHHMIMLVFSGSDWCIPCIRMHKEIFEDPAFIKMADSTLEMVNADFPRLKKNELPKAKLKQNEALAEKYDPEGKFPFTLLLDAEGKIIKSWDGMISGNATSFANEIKKIADAHR